MRFWLGKHFRPALNFAACLCTHSTHDIVCVLPGTHHDLVEALVFTRPGQVDLNIINGRVIVQDGSILTVDVPVSTAVHLHCNFPCLVHQEQDN